MAVRRPLVIIGGVVQQLPAGDTIPSTALATDVTTVDFGAGADIVTIAVARAAVTAAAAVMAFLDPGANTDHTVDEHLVDGPDVWAHSVVAGVGFSISARAREDVTTGKWNVRWWSTE